VLPRVARPRRTTPAPETGADAVKAHLHHKARMSRQPPRARA
jgi:hypothetical protein